MFLLRSACEHYYEGGKEFLEARNSKGQTFYENPNLNAEESGCFRTLAEAIHQKHQISFLGPITVIFNSIERKRLFAYPGKSKQELGAEDRATNPRENREPDEGPTANSVKRKNKVEVDINRVTKKRRVVDSNIK
jgi:hypothetical protein